MFEKITSLIAENPGTTALVTGAVAALGIGGTAYYAMRSSGLSSDLKKAVADHQDFLSELRGIEARMDAREQVRHDELLDAFTRPTTQAEAEAKAA